MRFLKCTVYLTVVSMLGFLAGRLLPKQWIHPEKGLFRSRCFEQNGSIYEKLGIRKWHKRLPDMSRILPGLMPAKSLSGNYGESLPEMIQETCVAEVDHIAVSVAGLSCLWIWPGIGGVTVTAIYILLLNVPYILIQRYNRPRLLRLQRKRMTKEKSGKEAYVCLQYSACG